MAKLPKAKRPPQPAADQPWTVQTDQNAPTGNLVPALARLLLALVEQESERRESHDSNEPQQGSRSLRD